MLYSGEEMASDRLITTAVFSKNEEEKRTTRDTIRTEAENQGVIPSSIFPLYTAIGTGGLKNPFTVPAINIRTLTYDTARIIFRLMLKRNIGPVIFEIARSEMGYTEQTPDEYTTSVLAAALAESYVGPVFIQGDHFQINKDKFSKSQSEEIGTIENLIRDAVSAKFYNIDIDASTLVDLTKIDPYEQQASNCEITAHFTSFIRNLQPKDVKIAIGGEIGHIGGVNSTVYDFRAFMDSYLKQVSGSGISKVSVQTGSSHGGTPLADGSVKKISIDFSVLKNIGNIAKNEYHLAGAVQHGASTLPLDLFDQFPKNNTCEIHLATGFQNIVFDFLPYDLKQEMYEYVATRFSDEKKPSQTDEQFIYTLRKKTLGPFKKRLWELRSEEKKPILDALEKQFEKIFDKLGIFGTKEIIEKYYNQEA